jgi:hypothetical protein
MAKRVIGSGVEASSRRAASDCVEGAWGGNNWLGVNLTRTGQRPIGRYSLFSAFVQVAYIAEM